MTTPPKVVKLGTSQVRQPPRMRSQAQIVEESSPEQKRRKTRTSLNIRKQRRTKVRLRKIRAPGCARGVSQKISWKEKRTKKQASEMKKTKGKRKGMKVLGMEFKACIVGTKGSRLNEIFEKAGGYRFSL